MIGKTLTHYQIISQLGKGGMGEVYQAKDQKLGRDVAIKVLPEEFAKDVDRVARFQREAKLLASLNHPNIAAIYGLEESDGTKFLVLELVEGDTLADQIKRGPIPVEESLKLALQIAEALEAAHEKGVIHRDLKPANIKVTPDGKVKVLDLGLAKALAGDQENVNPEDSPTLSVAATQKGVILGTAAYMSPEQAKGKTVDKRADIWAFGVVLYEMLTGQPAFQGEDVTDILASVVKLGVNLDLIPGNLNPRVHEILTRCLQKDIKNRYRDIGDVQFEIEQVLADPSGVFVKPGSGVEPRMRIQQMLPWLTAAVILGAIIAGAVVWNLRTPEPRQVSRFDYVLPEDQRFSSTERKLVAVSPDGTKIVYVANQQFYLRNLNYITASPIQGTDEDPNTPFFSPDGQWVGFWSRADKQLKKIAINGGAPIPLCDATYPSGATWGEDGTIVFGQPTGIMGVSENGGTAELIIETTEGEQVHGPQVLPGGEWVLFSITSASGPTRWDEADIVVESIKTGERKVLKVGGSDARYVPTGHLVYALGGILYAIAFDVDSLEVAGGEVQIIEGIRRASVPGMNPGTANYGFSDGGILVYAVGSDEVSQERSFVWIDREGKKEPLAAEPNEYSNFKISPKGTKVALTVRDGGNTDIQIWDLDSKNMTRLTFDEATDNNPLWTLDGKRIVFASNREGTVSVYWKAADGTGKVEKLGSVSGDQIVPSSWSRDGKDLLLEVVRRSDADIVAMSMEEDYKEETLLPGEFTKAHPQVSPDGRWMAYFSREDDQDEIIVCPFPDVSSGKWQVSDSGGIGPRWSPDGPELFYRNGGVMMAVAFETDPTFRRVGLPEELFRGTYFIVAPGHSWDISPDGKRFLMMKPADATAGPRKINIVLNWFEELKEQVPVP